MPILEVENVAVSFVQYARRFQQTELRVMEGITLSLEQGEIMGIIGSSGAGKSLLAHAIIGILPGNACVSGTIRYKGEVLDAAGQARLQGKELALVPQSVNYLDPLMRVGAQVRQAVPPGSNPVDKQRSIFARYHLKPSVEGMFPFQLSGGMSRRVLTATAAVSGAQLIIADEPTPGMHKEDVKEALQQLKELAQEGCSVLLITHDIEAALQITDRITVLYAGSVMETAAVEDFTGDGGQLRHPYSRALWNALPQNGFIPVACAQPRPDALPPGCLFQPYCPLATEECNQGRPDMRLVRGGNVRCIHAT